MIKFLRQYLYYILLFLLFGCGEEGNDVKDTDSKAEDFTKTEVEVKDYIDERLVSKDRKIEKILSDFGKPLNSYPTIFQDNTTIRKNGRLYRKNLLDEPFTGTVVENFSDGTLSLSTSYYRGLPHGQQIRNYPNGQRALVVNFDYGVLSGVKSRWWESGILREEAYWSEGNFLGRRLWDRTGLLIKEEIIPRD